MLVVLDGGLFLDSVRVEAALVVDCRMICHDLVVQLSQGILFREQLGNHIVALFVLYFSECLINRTRSEKLTSDRASILVHATGYCFGDFSSHYLPHLRVLLTRKVSVIGLPAVRISLGDDICVSEKFLNHLHVGHEKLVHGIIRAKRLHANHFPSDLSIELEANCHLAALGKGAILAEQDDIEDLFYLVEGNTEGKLLPIHHWPVREHEIFD